MSELLSSLSPQEQGQDGSPVILLSGPPVGAAMFRDVQRRLAPRRTVALDLVAPEAAAEGLRGLGRQLGQLTQELGARVVVAHGAAVPVALSLPDGAVDLLVLSDGPLSQVDPVLAALSRWPEPALVQLFRPGILNRWLASSLGLRRTVVNPYTMERDIVVMLTRPWTQSPTGRLAAARWLRALRDPLPLAPPRGARVLLAWGDADPLYPFIHAESFLKSCESGSIARIPGARHHHPEERPWALADLIAEALAAQP